MAIQRHVYRPPRGKMSGVFAILGGVIATIAVFVAIPLSQKLADMTAKPVVEPEEISIAPPETELLAEMEPPPEPEEEPPPPEPMDEPTDIDSGLDLSDLPLGTGGGGFVMNIPKFAMKGDDAFGGMDSPPVPTSKFPPSYPSSLLSKGIGGKVLIACEVDESGKIISTKVRQSSGHPELDKAALAAVTRWKFKPGTKSGRKVRASCVVPFNFEVKKN
ncbi:energy transducer TonB [Luteolibacter marinus]|uniref:energy transducer TonB n=1 Tax=Luteolibacter marinus TaxID=2776705 RepID=UPI0018686AE3|nr:energy transducer TonB [Luteolibacter marinus]